MHTTLLTARKRKGLTGEQLARLTGVDRSTISRLERGQTLPMLDTAKRLEKALGVSLTFKRSTGVQRADWTGLDRRKS